MYTYVSLNYLHINEQMQSDIKQAEATLVSLKSHTEACHSELREVENQLSSQHAELQQLNVKLADIPHQTEILSDKVLQQLEYTTIILLLIKLYSRY